MRAGVLLCLVLDRFTLFLVLSLSVCTQYKASVFIRVSYLFLYDNILISVVTCFRFDLDSVSSTEILTSTVWIGLSSQGRLL